MRKKIILTNDFHGTSTILYAKQIYEGLLFVTEQQATRVRERLCGSDCMCGNSLGMRPTGVSVTPTTGGYFFTE